MAPVFIRYLYLDRDIDAVYTKDRQNQNNFKVASLTQRGILC